MDAARVNGESCLRGLGSHRRQKEHSGRAKHQKWVFLEDIDLHWVLTCHGTYAVGAPPHLVIGFGGLKLHGC